MLAMSFRKRQAHCAPDMFLDPIIWFLTEAMTGRKNNEQHQINHDSFFDSTDGREILGGKTRAAVPRLAFCSWRSVC